MAGTIDTGSPQLGGSTIALGVVELSKGKNAMKTKITEKKANDIVLVN